MESASEVKVSKKYLFVVMAYPVKEGAGPAKVWGSNKVAVNSTQEGWIDIGATATGNLAAKLVVMGEASEIRENAKRYSARDDYRYLILPAREWESA